MKYYTLSRKLYLKTFFKKSWFLVVTAKIKGNVFNYVLIIVHGLSPNSHNGLSPHFYRLVISWSIKQNINTVLNSYQLMKSRSSPSELTLATESSTVY